MCDWSTIDATIGTEVMARASPACRITSIEYQLIMRDVMSSAGLIYSCVSKCACSHNRLVLDPLVKKGVEPWEFRVLRVMMKFQDFPLPVVVPRRGRPVPMRCASRWMGMMVQPFEMTRRPEDRTLFYPVRDLVSPRSVVGSAVS